MERQFDERTIRQWYDIFKDNHDLVEIRGIRKTPKETWSGYFTDADHIIAEIGKHTDIGLYFTLNDIFGACYSRVQHDVMVKNPTTTSDIDISSRKWLLIDVDCEKPSDTNSTDEEKRLAQPVVNSIYKFLNDQGFSRPVVCDSANGYHLLYKIHMDNSKENLETISNILKFLDLMFSTEKVKIDTTVDNASRICKLYGTYSRKGFSTSDRPQRLSYIMKVPEVISVTHKDYLAKVAAMLPKKEEPNRWNNYSRERFDLEGFIKRHGISVSKVVSTSAYTKYVLEECPFDGSHKSPDSAIFQLADGAVGFKCFHNHCADYHWRDVRMLYEPDAYENHTRMELESKMKRTAAYESVAKSLVVHDDDGKADWLSLSEISYVDVSKLPSIPTGVKTLDSKTGGLLLGDLTVLSGLNASGKSSLINILALNAADAGFKTAMLSMELQDFRLKNWIVQPAAGKKYAQRKAGYDNLYYIPAGVSSKVSLWLDGRLWIYNNNKGNRFDYVFGQIRNAVEVKGCQLVIIDNMMSMNISMLDGDKYSQQSAFVYTLKEYCKQRNIHVILVVHPRKSLTFLRKEDMSGTADITNLADNVLIIHRVNKDFETRAGDFFGKDKVSIYTQYDVVIEIAKNRAWGVSDELIGMYFEKESRRLKNEPAENVIYSWDDSTPYQTYDDLPHLESMPPNERFTDYRNETPSAGSYSSFSIDDVPF